MALKYLQNNDRLIDYGSLNALVLDDIPGMRSALKMTLSNFGITRTDIAATAQEVIMRLTNGSQYDLILSDYNLGDGRDGQQLLEELRFRNLITRKTAFVMVTADAMYEAVAASSELTPDDYLLKPFNAELMRNRLDLILHRKLVFSRIYTQFASGDLEAAMLSCEDLIKAKPRFLIDALRQKGEILFAMGRFSDVEALYSQVLDMRELPWARLGLARALHLQGRSREAEQHLVNLLERAPELLSAYDLLADVRLALKDPQGAQRSLQQGASLSGKTVRRQQRLGEIAYDNGDLNVANAAFESALEKGRFSIFVTPVDYGNLCRVQIERGMPQRALDTLKRGKNQLQTSPEGQLVMATMQSVVYTRQGQAESARKSMEEAVRLHKNGVASDGRLMLDLAGSCMANGEPELGDAIVSEVARNAHDSEALLNRTKQIYVDHGREGEGKQILDSATSIVRKLTNEAMLQAKNGDYVGASDRLLEATRTAPRNPRLLMNTAWMLLRRIDVAGYDQGLLCEIRNLLDEAERQAPTHHRLPSLRGMLRDVESRHGGRGKERQ